MNYALTVEKGKAGPILNYGNHIRIILLITFSKKHKNIIFVLWGN